MNYVKTLIAIIVLACLAYYSYNLSQTPEEAPDAKKAAVVSGFDFDALSNIQIRRSYDTFPIEFSRANVNAEWMMQKPFATLADQSVVNELANDLKLAKADSVIPAAEVANPANFGFGTNSIVLTLKSGTREIAINYGKKNPEGTMCYIGVGTEKDVKLGEGKLFDAVVKKVNDYRDKKVAAYSPAAVKWFEISCPKAGGPPLRFRKNQYTWYFESPRAGARCDGYTIDDILKSNLNVVTKGFVEPEDQSYAANNVTDSGAELLMRFGTDGTGEVTNALAFGGDRPFDNACYLKSSYKKELLYVEKGVREHLVKLYKAGFQPKTCIDFETANANRIVMAPADTISAELKKVSSEWKYEKLGTAAVQINAEAARVEGLLQKIRDCKVLSVCEGTTDAELLNDFKKPALELRLGLNFSDRTESVLLVPANYSKHPYVTGDEKDRYYEVKKENLEDVMLSVRQLCEAKETKK